MLSYICNFCGNCTSLRMINWGSARNLSVTFLLTLISFNPYAALGLWSYLYFSFLYSYNWSLFCRKPALLIWIACLLTELTSLIINPSGIIILLIGFVHDRRSIHKYFETIFIGLGICKWLFVLQSLLMPIEWISIYVVLEWCLSHAGFKLIQLGSWVYNK